MTINGHVCLLAELLHLLVYLIYFSKYYSMGHAYGKRIDSIYTLDDRRISCFCLCGE